MREETNLPEDWDPRAPGVKLLYSIGNQNPLENGGGHLIYEVKHKKSPLMHQSIYFGEPIEAFNGRPMYKVWRWFIEDDVLRDQDWMGRHERLSALAKALGASVQDLRKASVDPDMRVRAKLYEDIGRHYGFENGIDEYPEWYSKTKMIQRFPELGRVPVR